MDKQTRKEMTRRLKLALIIVGSGLLLVIGVALLIIGAVDGKIIPIVLGVVMLFHWGLIRFWASRDGDPEPDIEL
jgi:hypothetical protein